MIEILACKNQGIHEKQCKYNDIQEGDTPGTGIAIYMRHEDALNKVREADMKKVMVTVLVLVVGFMFVSPTIGYSQSWDRYAGRYTRNGGDYYGYSRTPYPTRYPSHPEVYHERSRGNDALLVAGVVLGGIALGAVIGNLISTRQPQREVAYSEPVYAPQATTYGNSGYDNQAGGQWVTVAGQWVNGKWVPAHSVWVP